MQRVVGENVVVLDHNSKTVTAKVDNADALKEALTDLNTLESGSFANAKDKFDWVYDITVDEETAETAIEASSAISIPEGVTLNLKGGDLAEDSESERVGVDATSNGITNAGTLNIENLALQGKITSNLASATDKKHSASLNVVNSVVTVTSDEAIDVKTGSASVTNSTILAGSTGTAVKVEGKDVKVTVENSTFGKLNKKGTEIEDSAKIDVAGEKAIVNVTGSKVYGGVEVASTGATASKVTLANTDVVGTVKLDATSSVLDVTGGSIVSLETETSAITSDAKATDKESDTVTISLNNTNVKAPDDAVAMFLKSAGTYTVSGSTVTGGTGIEAINGTINVKSSTVAATAAFNKAKTKAFTGDAVVDGNAISLFSYENSNVDNDDLFVELSLTVDSSTLNVKDGQRVSVYAPTTLGVKDISISANYPIGENNGILVDGASNKIKTKHTDNLAEVVVVINGEVYDPEA